MHKKEEKIQVNIKFRKKTEERKTNSGKKEIRRSTSRICFIFVQLKLIGGRWYLL